MSERRASNECKCGCTIDKHKMNDEEEFPCKIHPECSNYENHTRNQFIAAGISD